LSHCRNGEECQETPSPTLFKPSQPFIQEFSTSFNLKLTSHILKTISSEETSISSSSLRPLKQLGGDQLNSIPRSMLEGDRLPYDQIWQDIIQNISKGKSSRDHIYVTHSELTRLSQQLSEEPSGDVTPAIFFTCGHYFTKSLFDAEIEKIGMEAFVGGVKLVETMSVIKTFYERKGSKPLACPRCVFSAILSISSDTFSST